MTDLKTCASCGVSRSISEFALRSHRASLDNRCRACRAAYQKEHYERNRNVYVARSRRRRVRIRRERFLWLLDHLAAHPCVDCGESDPRVLEFDHLSDKSFSIGTWFSQRNWDALLREIQKCDVVCANCHSRRTSERRRTLRYRLSREPMQTLLF